MSNAGKHAISLVVPVYNERETIGELLSSLKSQRRVPDEIVIVDAGSIDDTAARVDAERGDLPVRLVRSPVRLLPGAARNLGVANSSSPFIAFTDAGIRVDPVWLAELAEVQTRTGASLVFGSYEPVLEREFDRWLAIAYVEAPRLVEGQRVRTDSIASSLVSRALFDQAGGFREDLRSAEDLLFIRRAKQLVDQVAYAPSALVRWRLPSTVSATFQRFARYSEHNLVAGLYDDWHRSLVRRYGVMLAACVAIGFWSGPLVAVPTFIGLSIGQWLLRAQSRMNRYAAAGDPPSPWFSNLVGTAAMTAVIDAATFKGLASWLGSVLKVRP